MARETEQRAEDAIAWYMHHRKRMKASSRLTRAFAILFGSLGGLTPLAPFVERSSSTGWGILLVGAAAACIAFDRLFGLSTAWMRDLCTAQDLQDALTAFHIAWARSYIANRQFSQADLVAEFSNVISDILRDETANWLREFHANLEALRGQLSQRSRKEINLDTPLGHL